CAYGNTVGRRRRYRGSRRLLRRRFGFLPDCRGRAAAHVKLETEVAVVEDTKSLRFRANLPFKRSGDDGCLGREALHGLPELACVFEYSYITAKRPVVFGFISRCPKITGEAKTGGVIK